MTFPPFAALAPRLLLSLPLLLLAACSVAPRAGRDALPAPVILVSLDGFHPGYLERGLTPTLRALADGGTRAEWMNPSYPTKTFPNHYTLVTGLRPDRHGIVNNQMIDVRLGSFRTSDRKAVEDVRWWGGEPIWNTARRAGLRTASMFWVGSETRIGGAQPDHWSRFDYRVGHDERVDRVLRWLDLPEAERPRLITLYFEHVDAAGHAHGPDAPQTDAAIAEADRALARLHDGLRARGLVGRVNLVIVSDHGMAAISPERVVILDELVSPDALDIVTQGEMLGAEPKAGREAEAMRLLRAGHPHLRCWRRGTLPARWRYGHNPRVPAITCQADEGWLVMTRASFDRWRRAPNFGAHGYAVEAPSMRAMFIGHGPAFRRGAVLPPFDNVDVYPLLAHLLGIEPAENDGDLAVLAPALRQ